MTNPKLLIASTAKDMSPNVGTALIGAGAVMGGSLLTAPSEFGSVTDKVVEYLPHLAKIVKTARDLSLTGFGLKEAHDLYKWFAGDQK